MGSDGVDVRLVVPDAVGTPAPVATPAVPVPGGSPTLDRPSLPRTGVELLAVLLLAVLLLALGTLLVQAGRARRRTA